MKQEDLKVGMIVRLINHIENEELIVRISKDHKKDYNSPDGGFSFTPLVVIRGGYKYNECSDNYATLDGDEFSTDITEDEADRIMAQVI